MVPLDQPIVSFEMMAWFTHYRHSKILSSDSSLTSVEGTRATTHTPPLLSLKTVPDGHKVLVFNASQDSTHCPPNSSRFRSSCAVDVLFYSPDYVGLDKLALQKILLIEWRSIVLPSRKTQPTASITVVSCSAPIEYICLRLYGNVDEVSFLVEELKTPSLLLKNSIVSREFSSVSLKDGIMNTSADPIQYFYIPLVLVILVVWWRTKAYINTRLFSKREN
jgi:hypothetical protein